MWAPQEGVHTRLAHTHTHTLGAACLLYVFSLSAGSPVWSVYPFGVGLAGWLGPVEVRAVCVVLAISFGCRFIFFIYRTLGRYEIGLARRCDLLASA